jgi:hypothetical protein
MIKLDPGAGEAGVQLDRAGEQTNGLLDIGFGHLLELLGAE